MPTSKDGRGRFTRSIVQVDLDREAAELYMRYRSYRGLAEHLGVDVNTAWHRVQRALISAPLPDSESAKRVALARLDAMAVIAQRVAEQEHLAHSNGHVVGIMVPVDPANPDGEKRFEPLIDPGPNLAAIDRLQRLEDQRNRLLGIYAPTAARVEVIPAEVIEKAVAENLRTIRAAELELGLPHEDLDDEIVDAEIVE